MPIIEPIPDHYEFLVQLNQLPLEEYQKVIASYDLFKHFRDELYVEGETLTEYLSSITWQECPLCNTIPIYKVGTRIIEDFELIKPCGIHQNDNI